MNSTPTKQHINIRSSINFLVIAFIAMTLNACSGDSNGNVSQSDLQKILVELQQNKTKWESNNLTSYEYNFNLACYCAVVGDMHVTVYEGTATEAFYLDNSEYLSDAELLSILTVDEAFDKIEYYVSLNPRMLNVTFDETLGYPEVIDVDIDEGVADDEIVYTFSAVM